MTGKEQSAALAAMPRIALVGFGDAGQSFASGWREVSGICTHPDAQGRGLARRLTAKLIRRQLLRGETPFLHVMRANEAARTLYRRMGFVDDRESVVRVIRRA